MTMAQSDAPRKRQKLQSLDSVEERASRLLNKLSASLQSKAGLGSFTSAIYDSAWVATVRKPGGSAETQQLAFPECFDYLLETQNEEGSWPTYASEVDGILNTAAALLALHKHPSRSRSSTLTDRLLDNRICRAQIALQAMLQKWNVSECDHVGYEVLVPRMLEYLFDYGFQADFPGRVLLRQQYQGKLGRFHPAMVYSKQKTTLLHSLEGFIGLIDFDQVAHHLDPATGIMGSPASTAAYLSYASAWSNSAEDYLRRIIECGTGSSVPSAFPTPVFEASWALTVLHAGGFSIDPSTNSNVAVMVGFLRETLIANKGVTGFIPGVLADADDTAKSIAALQTTHEHPDIQPMLDTFETETNFKTYALEKNSSFSANCNVLSALLGQVDTSATESSIAKAAEFLVSSWNDDAVSDKWNLASEYSYMSLALPLVKLLQRWDSGELRSLPEDLPMIQIPIVLIQLLSRLVRSQDTLGGWRQSVEVTAYSVLAISKLLGLAWSPKVRQGLEDTLARARQYLSDNDALWGEAEYLWVEKVTYGSPVLSEMYCLAAMNASSQELTWNSTLGSAFETSSKKTQQMTGLLRQLPLYEKTAPLLLQLAAAEASLFVYQLRDVRLDIFSERDASMTEDKWLDFIPLAWTSINTITNNPLPTKIMREMMVLSMLNYQADEYVESVVCNLSEHGLMVIDTILKSECGLEKGSSVLSPSKQPHTLSLGDTLSSTETNQRRVRHTPTPPSSNSSSKHGGAEIQDVERTLRKFIKHVLQHPSLLAAPEHAQIRVSRELYGYLKAQIAHGQSNALFAAEKSESAVQGVYLSGQQEVLTTFHTTSQTYIDWVRTIGADDTSCPYSFAFFCCLISKPSEYCLAGVEQMYLGDAMCRNLATMCRQYNDYGSLARDMAESNLNSLNFPEFANSNGGGMQAVDKVKSQLMSLAEFERSCMQVSLERLRKVTTPATASGLQSFVNVTDLFGQLYVAKDIASRVKGKMGPQQDGGKHGP